MGEEQALECYGRRKNTPKRQDVYRTVRGLYGESCFSSGSGSGSRSGSGRVARRRPQRRGGWQEQEQEDRPDFDCTPIDTTSGGSAWESMSTQSIFESDGDRNTASSTDWLSQPYASPPPPKRHTTSPRGARACSSARTRSPKSSSLLRKVQTKRLPSSRWCDTSTGLAGSDSTPRRAVTQDGKPRESYYRSHPDGPEWHEEDEWQPGYGRYAGPLPEWFLNTGGTESEEDRWKFEQVLVRTLCQERNIPVPEEYRSPVDRLDEEGRFVFRKPLPPPQGPDGTYDGSEFDEELEKMQQLFCPDNPQTKAFYAAMESAAAGNVPYPSFAPDSECASWPEFQPSYRRSNPEGPEWHGEDWQPGYGRYAGPLPEWFSYSGGSESEEDRWKYEQSLVRLLCKERNVPVPEEFRLPWDVLDEQGRMVPPGKHDSGMDCTDLDDSFRTCGDDTSESFQTCDESFSSSPENDECAGSDSVWNRTFTLEHDPEKFFPVGIGPDDC